MATTNGRELGVGVAAAQVGQGGQGLPCAGEAEGAVAAGSGEAVGLGEGGAGLLGAGRVVHDGGVQQRGRADGAEGGGSFGDRHVDGGAVRGGRDGPFTAGHGGAHRPCGLQQLERLRAAGVVLGERGDERGEFVQVAVGGGLVAVEAEVLLHGFGEPLDLTEGPDPGLDPGAFPDVLPESAGSRDVVPAAPDPAGGRVDRGGSLLQQEAEGVPAQHPAGAQEAARLLVLGRVGSGCLQGRPSGVQQVPGGRELRHLPGRLEGGVPHDSGHRAQGGGGRTVAPGDRGPVLVEAVAEGAEGLPGGVEPVGRAAAQHPVGVRGLGGGPRPRLRGRGARWLRAGFGRHGRLPSSGQVKAPMVPQRGAGAYALLRPALIPPGPRPRPRPLRRAP
ncbi:hypothetical protein [Streptomyces albidoflavus]|uniref:hypothetical protein n=1 Tax=Streptomyces albidoflavus TaxID=1886 RepID=UPI001596A154|nr:hypothetical protein [Streptomyces albidoflavus]